MNSNSDSDSKITESENPNLAGNPKRDCFERTFGPLNEGSIRGNMFLLIVTTIGSAFFVLPHCARQIGIFFMCSMTLVSASLSIICSQILYIGFTETNAKTYNECMEKLLGKRIGFFSTLVVTMHTLGTSVSTWIFAWIYLSDGIAQYLKFDTKITPIPFYLQNLYFVFGMLLIFGVTLFRSIEKLKIVSIIGFVIIIYLVAVFVGLTPHYFKHFNSLGLIRMIPFKVDIYALKVWGITNYMFLNQYAITPICKNTKDVCFRRVSKIIGRTIVLVCLIYILILFCGYFSLPTNIINENFLLRSPIEGDDDYLIMYGKILFGLALFVGVMVRSHFVLIYFDQLIQKFKEVFFSSGDGDYVMNAQNDTGETATMTPRTALIVWKPIAIIRNFCFLAILATLATLGVEYLLKILGFIGSFVGVFELIIIPACMFLVIDRKKRLMARYQRMAFVYGSVLLTSVSICAVFANLLL